MTMFDKQFVRAERA